MILETPITNVDPMKQAAWTQVFEDFERLVNQLAMLTEELGTITPDPNTALAGEFARQMIERDLHPTIGALVFASSLRGVLRGQSIASVHATGETIASFAQNLAKHVAAHKLTQVLTQQLGKSAVTIPIGPELTEVLKRLHDENCPNCSSHFPEHVDGDLRPIKEEDGHVN